MATEAPARLLTAEEFWKLPDPPEGGKMELVCGEVVYHMPVGGPHSRVAGRLIIRLGAFAERHHLGVVGPEWGFVLARVPDVVRAPDVHFVRASRMPGGQPMEGFFDGPPDLAVEVISPEDRDSEVDTKVGQYRAAGTPRVWVVRPSSGTVTVYYPDGTARVLGGEDVLTSDHASFQIEGFTLPVAEIFA